MGAGSLMAEVRQNSERIRSCPRHKFPERGDTYRLGEKLMCEVCGGRMSLTDVGSYLRGYRAAGGSTADVMPDWKEAP